MSVSNEQVQLLMKRSEQRERRVRRLALLLTVIPLVFGLAFLAYSIWNTSRVQQELEVKTEALETADVVLQETINKYQTADIQLAEAARTVAEAERKAEEASQAAAVALSQAEASQAEVQALSGRLEENSAKLADYEREVASLQTALVTKENQFEALDTQVQLASQLQVTRDYSGWQVWLKEAIPYLSRVYINDPAGAALIARLLNVLDSLFAQSPPYNLLGASVEEGFNSPSFAMHVLAQIGRVPAPRTPVLDQAALRDYLLANGMVQRRERVPRAGDLVLYEDGFAMFYFPDPQQQQPLVIGMTAGGVSVLAPDFAPVVDVIAVGP